MRNDIHDNTCDIIDSLVNDGVDEAIKEQLDKKGELVKKTMDIFSSIYKNAVKQTYISNIINGEIIKTKDTNIFIDEDLEFNSAQEEQFTKMQQYCNKHLYDYQKNAIRKLVTLEKRGYNINRSTQNKLISNGWLLSLPIGSGKSIVFEFLSIFYRNVPAHPIIISTDGHNVQAMHQVNISEYPFYYENCGYIERDANAVVTLKGYVQRRCTVILTHSHLLDQMQMYFTQDFPTLFKPKEHVKVVYSHDMFNIDIDNLDILVVTANKQNVQTLVAMSYIQPFMRVIIDDYTSMCDIETFRQILASSTIFVSGSKFQREVEDIPPSYYTLKYMPVDQLSVVGKPAETLKGILRDNIATMELMGNSCEFNTYTFVHDCEQSSNNTFRKMPSDVYPIIKTEPKIKNYLAFKFIYNHLARFKQAIYNIEKSLESGKVKPEEVSYYLQWKEMLKDVKNNPPPVERVKINGKVVVKAVKESNNPLYNTIYDFKNIVINQADSSPVLSHKCYCCGNSMKDHQCYGMISACCGAFFCSNCLDNMCTHYIKDSSTGEELYDHDHRYCVCCRERNPVYMFNINHKKNTTNVHSYYLANEYFDVSALQGHQLFDYYFYMCTYGFVPLKANGKAINIHKDIELGVIDSSVFKKKTIPTLDKLLSRDHLALLSLSVINQTLYSLGIMPRSDAIILVYNCPNEMRDRVNNYYKSIIAANNKSTALQTTNGQYKQPIANLKLEYKNNVGELIGLHKNIVAILQWNIPKNVDEVAQLLGRCLRLNNFNNKLYFYITTSTTAFS